MKKLFSIVFTILLCSCDRGDKKLMLKNATTDTVFFIVQAEKEIKTGDEPIFYADPKSQYRFENCLLPMEQERYSLINTNWEKYIDRIEDGKIKIFFFNKQLLDTTNWDKIVSEQIASRKIEYDAEELKLLNWQVNYDRTE